jgi:glycine/D-amino acid oxidase-like deaminating enzyme
MPRPEYDFVVIGGGFYGCCLALILRSISDRVLLIEAGETLLERASRVNQARIHTCYHYPRSFLTALRSMALHRRFAEQFPDAVVDDFRMLYAVAQRNSKVSAGRFLRMFTNLGAPVRAAPPGVAALFSPSYVQGVYEVREAAFDYQCLRRHLVDRLDRHRVDLLLGNSVERIYQDKEMAVLELQDGATLGARHVFNVTYAMLNSVLRASGCRLLPLKHEFVEIALVKPPPPIAGYGITVMDGPFFSIMPYPPERLYSLSHVRYSPHYSWVDENIDVSAYRVAELLPRESRWRHMMADARRFMPCLTDLEWQHSLFDVKTILTRNERNDGRPILFHRHAEIPSLISVMGGKIDNIYDLFDVLPLTDARFRGINLEYLQ